MELKPQKKEEPDYKDKVSAFFKKFKKTKKIVRLQGRVPANEQDVELEVPVLPEEIIEIPGDVCMPLDPKGEDQEDGAEVRKAPEEIVEVVRLEGDVCMPLKEEDEIEMVGITPCEEEK